MSLKAIRELYEVPAYRGEPVTLIRDGKIMKGTIKSCKGTILTVVFPEIHKTKKIHVKPGELIWEHTVQ